MAAIKDKEQKAPLDPDEEESESIREDGDNSAEQEKSIESTPEKEKNGGLINFLFYRRWTTLLFSLCLGGLLFGVGLPYGLKYLHSGHNIPVVSSTNPMTENMREEGIAPFFIPLPPDSSKEVIRIDLTLVLDGLASLRYMDKEVRVRDRFYRYLMGFAKKDQDLNIKISILESEMSQILRDSLGMNNVLVRLKEIKSF